MDKNTWFNLDESEIEKESHRRYLGWSQSQRDLAHMGKARCEHLVAQKKVFYRSQVIREMNESKLLQIVSGQTQVTQDLLTPLSLTQSIDSGNVRSFATPIPRNNFATPVPKNHFIDNHLNLNLLTPLSLTESIDSGKLRSFATPVPKNPFINGNQK